MNVFRLLADMSHLASKIILIRRIFAMRSCRGLSLKTQAVYVLVFITRYLDLFTHWISLYNNLMKVFYITSSCYIIYLIVEKFRPMDEEESTDTFKVQYIILPCFILSFFFNYSFTPMEIAWSFSIFLEALAILPQLHMLLITGQAEALTRYYILTLGCYRALYILNWIYRYIDSGIVDPIAAVGGTVQTFTNFYFIYVYLKKYPREIDIESPPESSTQAPPAAPKKLLPTTEPAIPSPEIGESPVKAEDANNEIPSPHAGIVNNVVESPAAEASS